MKTKLLISTAIVAAAFTSNAFAEALNIGNGINQTVSENASYDSATISGGRLEINSPIGSHLNVSVTGNVIITAPTAMEDGWEEQLLVNESTLSAANITATGSTEVDRSGGIRLLNSTLIADTVSVNNADITVMGGTGNDGNTFILAGKSYNSNNDYSNSYLRANVVSLSSEENYGIGDDRINFIVEDDVILNISGKAGMSAGSIADKEGGGVEILDDYGKLDIKGGTVNLSDDAMMIAFKDVTIAGGEVNLRNNAQIVSLAYDCRTDGCENNSNDNEYQLGTILGEHGDFKMTGGTLNVYGNNKITGKNYVTITGGELNVKEGATLHNRSGDGEIFKNTGFLVTGNGVMNIAGRLVSPVTSLNNEDTSPVAVANGGILRLSSNTATIESTVGILNRGTLDIGSYSPTITGPVIFANGATLGVKVNSKEEHGTLNANVLFKDGSSITIDTDNSMNVGDYWDNVSLINGQIAVENENNDLSNGRFNIIMNNDGTFNIKYTQSARDRVAEAGGSVSIGDAADAWDGLDIVGSGSAGAIADLLKELSRYNAVGYTEALKTLAPSAAPVVQQTQSETANQVFNAVGSRLSGGSTNSSQGMSSGDALEDASVWVQGLANHAKLNKTAQADGFKSDTFGTALGLEKKINNNVKAGLGYAYSKTDVDATGRDTDVKTHTALVYGEYKPSNWFVNGIMSYGWSDYDESKNVAGNIVKAKYDAETFGLQTMTGYDFFTKYATITPEMGLRYVHIKTDGYTDSAMQSVSGNDSDILTGVIGSRISKTFETSNGLRLTPEAKLAMTYDLKHDNVTANVTLPNGSSYSVNGKALDRFGVEVGGNLTAEINDNVELSLGYEGKFREDYQDHSGLINFKYNF